MRVILPDVLWVDVGTSEEGLGWQVAFETPCQYQSDETGTRHKLLSLCRPVRFAHGHILLIDEEGGYCRVNMPIASQAMVQRLMQGDLRTGSITNEVADAICALPEVLALPKEMPIFERVLHSTPKLVERFKRDVFLYP